MRKPGLSKTEHEELGRTLSKMYNKLVSVSVQVHNAYPQHNRAYKPAEKAWKAVDHFRSELEDVMFGEHPSMGCSVYYGHYEKHEEWNEAVKACADMAFTAAVTEDDIETARFVKKCVLDLLKNN